MSLEQEKAAELWADGARDALDTAQKLLVSKKYHHALFFCHLAVEKALKSIYIVQHDEYPPYSHELRLLAAKVEHSLTDGQVADLDTINTFNIAARYQEEKQELYRRARPEYTKRWVDAAEKIIHVLLK